MQIDTTDKKEQRKFGLVMAVAIGVIALIRWWHKGVVPTVFFSVAAVFLLLGLLLPSILRPVLVVWLKFAEILNRTVTLILLTLSFFLLIVPTRVILRVLGHDPLKRKWEPDADTYWEEPEGQPSDLESYRKQF